MSSPDAFASPCGERLASIIAASVANTVTANETFLLAAGSPSGWPTIRPAAGARTLVWFSALAEPDAYDAVRAKLDDPLFLHGNAGLDQLEGLLATHQIIPRPKSVDDAGIDALFELKGAYLQQLVVEVRGFLEGCPDDRVEASRAWRDFLQRVEGSAGTYEFAALATTARGARQTFESEASTLDADGQATLEDETAAALTGAIQAAVEDHRAQVSKRLPTRIGKDARHRALILAKDVGVAQQLRLALTHSELEALIHDTPETFIAALRVVRPDLAIVQEDLGAFDGFDLAAQVRTYDEFQSLPFVGLLEDAGERTRTRAASCGIHTYLVRPFSAENALRTVGAVLDQLDAQAALGGRDPVTGLFTRRALLDRLEMELLRSRRASHRVVLMLIHMETHEDDRYPRERLLDLASTVEDTFRRSDLLGRYNERTIAAVLPGADPRTVAVLMERLIDTIGDRMKVHISASIAEGGVSPELVSADAETRLTNVLEGQPGNAVGRCSAPTSKGPKSDAPRVLLVDNDEAILTLLKFFCQREGYIVSEARDGLSAIAQLDAAAENDELPDLVVLESYLPGVDGFSVLRKIRADFGGRVNVMMLTIQRNEERIAKAFNLGAADFVAKPFSVPEIMARIQNVLVRAGAV